MWERIGCIDLFRSELWFFQESEPAQESGNRICGRDPPCRSRSRAPRESPPSDAVACAGAIVLPGIAAERLYSERAARIAGAKAIRLPRRDRRPARRNERCQ